MEAHKFLPSPKNTPKAQKLLRHMPLCRQEESGMTVAHLKKQGIVATIEHRGVDCRAILVGLQKFDAVTQAALVGACASKAVREWGQGAQLQAALVDLATDDDFLQFSWLVGVFLQHVNNEIATYHSENVALQVANDNRLGGEANLRASRNIRLGVGIGVGGVGGGGIGGGIGAALGILGGPPGVAIGAGIGALIGGSVGGGIAHATSE
jgi:hypothetical protein